jgi:hypothetical protein
VERAGDLARTRAVASSDLHARARALSDECPWPALVDRVARLMPWVDPGGSPG